MYLVNNFPNIKKICFPFVHISGVQSAGWLDIHFTVGTSCERAAPLAEENVGARHHVLRSLISLHNEYRVYGAC
jgi:hypothetical protein